MTLPITAAEIARLRGIEKAATPRPWYWKHSKVNAPWTGMYAKQGENDCEAVGYTIWTKDAEVCVAARNALPVLLDEIERLRAALVEVKNATGSSTLQWHIADRALARLEPPKENQ